MSNESGGQAPGGRPWLAPGTQVAGFTLEGPLSRGSFGSVYRARRDGRLFAIKLVPIDPRSHREPDALRLMQHPNVVCFHGYGFWPDEQPRFLVLALELVEGRTLDVFVEEENPSALKLVLQVLLPLALTLADVHASGVVHRDIKEANIIMREADGQPVLVDFGAAGIEEARRLTTLLPPGTPEYRSPEALRFAREWAGEPYPSSPGDDLWALGVVLYWLLTRTLPFGDRDSPGMVRAILQETPPAPHVLNPRVPPPLSALCMRMLEKAPEARYAHAQALAEALSKEWAQADRSWRTPLFPGARRDKSPAPTPATPKLQASRRWWVAGLVLALVQVVQGVFFLPVWWRQSSTAQPLAQRTESPPLSPPRQTSPRQEIVPAGSTGEVGHGAEPSKSSTPAPVASATHSEEDAMPKFPKTGAVVAATCVASGCVSGPRQRPPPEPAECPPGIAESLKRLRIRPGESNPIVIPAGAPVLQQQEAIVSEGDVIAETHGRWGELPDDTPLYGKLFFGTGRVYARFTQARLPSGELVPVCLQVITPPKGLGTEMNPGSTSTKARIDNIPFAKMVLKFD